MATFKICVFEKHQKKNGTFPISIRVCWKRKYGFIKTEYYATIKQINKKTFELKDPFIIKELNSRIAKYEDIKVTKLGHNIELYTALDLAEYFKKEGAPGTDSSIDFIKFARLHCARLTAKGRNAKRIMQTVNQMIDFCGGRENVSITEVNAKFLNKFEDYLRSERTIKRKNQMGNIVTIKRKGVSDITVNGYMTDIRTLFNACRDENNDEDKGEIRIVHYPFNKYKLKPVSESNKRVLTPDQIKAIIICHPVKKRSILARDVFLLSFFLAGTNLIDLYDMDKSAYKNGRLSYQRKKTRGRRRDKAFISIKVYPEVLPLIEKYRGTEKAFKFSKMYSTSHIFDSNVNKGLKDIAKLCDIKENLNSYYARFSMASIARNHCGVIKDDINLVLNHIDEGLKVTDIYLEKDWSILDNAIKKVIDFVKVSE